VLSAANRRLQRLGTDHIDLYQLHWPSPNVPIEETMSGMEDLVDAGKVRFIGVSNFSLRQLREARAVMRKHPIVSNQVSYSLIDRHIEVDGLLSFCQTHRISVIAYSPLGHGLQKIRARDRSGVLARLAAMRGRTAAQIALNWCLSSHAVVAIPKASSLERIEENCRASGWRLTAEQVRILEDQFRRRNRLEVVLRRQAGRVLQATGLR
jgi:diketogulonate reductase-like aldo/keto reductase